MRHGELPEHVVQHGQTKVFTNETVPDALLNEHNTKVGVWGLIHVVEGIVTYHLSDTSISPVDLASGDEMVVAPQEQHFVRLAPNSAFYVSFYSLAE